MRPKETLHDINTASYWALKYENLINEVLFEEIPTRYKLQVAENFKNRIVPIQLNGTIGNNVRVEIVKLV